MSCPLIGAGLKVDYSRYAWRFRGLLGFFGGYLLGPALCFGSLLGFPPRFEGLGFTQQDFAEAGALLLADFFGVGTLHLRPDESAVFVLVSLANPSASLRAGCFFCIFCGFEGTAVAMVL
ncbi:hypothetical protein H7849_01090 [Alloacidobacterium dinghuense]|uniref:Uncharacterized protein n=1 Tax=Alloacidobacterium dinghuense TaxID=2763107 RepID=A0A7G8BJC6_9BACT|nr:hypothetical protein [Alloacidobacterium dinghuense]QNI32646.1 hypothetical protein H7849_01090 [Alloacidobacterium dinghuense]